MYTDNSFPLFESIMHGSLDPLAPAMAASSNYEQRILDQIVDAEKDNGIYSISFVAGRHLKEKYYRRLMLAETIAYCNDWLATFAAEDNSNILAYYRDSILDKHLKACMMRLHEKMLAANLQHSQWLTHSPNDGVEILKSLLELNHKIHAEEVEAGLWDKKKTGTKKPSKPKAYDTKVDESVVSEPKIEFK